MPIRQLPGCVITGGPIIWVPAILWSSRSTAQPRLNGTMWVTVILHSSVLLIRAPRKVAVADAFLDDIHKTSLTLYGDPPPIEVNFSVEA